MKQYQYLIFDLDDTLYHFAYAQSIALEMLYAEYFREHCDYQQFKSDYALINRECWREVEAGVIQAGEVSALRFAKIKEAFKTTADVQTLVDYYHRESCTRQDAWCRGAKEALALLTRQFGCALLSNGTVKDQQAKLQALRLTEIFSPVVLSDELGIAKPNPQVFEPIFAALNTRPENCLLIGDSLTSDYQAAINAGVDFCWFNEKKQARGDYPAPVVEVDDLMALVRYLRLSQASDGTFKD